MVEPTSEDWARYYSVMLEKDPKSLALFALNERVDAFNEANADGKEDKSRRDICSRYCPDGKP